LSQLESSGGSWREGSEFKLGWREIISFRKVTDSNIGWANLGLDSGGLRPDLVTAGPDEWVCIFLSSSSKSMGSHPRASQSTTG
jgi:hypothetical protein